jgi:hypothetical protein
MVTGKAAHDWVISSLNHVREDVSLIATTAKNRCLYRIGVTCWHVGHLLVQYFLTLKHSLASLGAVLLNGSLGREGCADRVPEPLSSKKSARWPTRHLYLHDGDTMEQVPPARPRPDC